MCDPVTGMMAVSAVSGAMQMRASSQQASHTKAVGAYNQRVQENQAQAVRNKGTEQVNQARQEAAQLQSKQRAIAASRGVLTTEGTALQTTEDTQLIGDINALRIRRNAEDQAAALETQSVLTGAEAGGRAAAIRNQGTLGALESARKVKSSWYQLSSMPTAGGAPSPTNFNPAQFGGG